MTISSLSQQWSEWIDKVDLSFATPLITLPQSYVYDFEAQVEKVKILRTGEKSMLVCWKDSLGTIAKR